MRKKRLFDAIKEDKGKYEVDKDSKQGCVSNKFADLPKCAHSKKSQLQVAKENEVYIFESATTLPTVLAARIFCSIYTIGMHTNKNVLWFRNFYEFMKITNIGIRHNYKNLIKALKILVKTAITIKDKEARIKDGKIVNGRFISISHLLYAVNLKEEGAELCGNYEIEIKLNVDYLEMLKRKGKNYGFTLGDMNVINKLNSHIEFNLYFMLKKYDFTLFQHHKVYNSTLDNLCARVDLDIGKDPGRAYKRLQIAVRNINDENISAYYRNDKKDTFNCNVYHISKEGKVVIIKKAFDTKQWDKLTRIKKEEMESRGIVGENSVYRKMVRIDDFR